MTLDQAHRAVKVFVRDAKGEGTRAVFVITGRSGQIREEFLDWVEHMPAVERSQMLPNRGSFRLLLSPK
jgi:DNA-nicking Smr family endonuclease